jgi:hypothetical protein
MIKAQMRVIRKTITLGVTNWKGANGDFKYHMVKWSVVCRPKEFRGLGIINT